MSYWRENWEKTKADFKEHAEFRHFLFLLGLIFICICPFLGLIEPGGGFLAFGSGLLLMFLAANARGG